MTATVSKSAFSNDKACVTIPLDKLGIVAQAFFVVQFDS
jgi:hypothetical protein